MRRRLENFMLKKVLKWSGISVAVIVVALILLTIFGPWDTYRWAANKPGDFFLSQSVYVADLPVWFGSILKVTNGAITLKIRSIVSLRVVPVWETALEVIPQWPTSA